MYFSSKIALYSFEKDFSDKFIFYSFVKIPKKKQKLSINKSPHVFKKSKERFIAHKPSKIIYVTPYFSSNNLLQSYLKSVLKFFYFLSFSNQVKLKIMVSCP
jgi:ribosomal protein S10